MTVGVLILAACLFLNNPVPVEPFSFDAIYSFGGSSADTGSFTATLGPLTSPYGGDIIFHRPQRFTNGRLIVDFLSNGNNSGISLPKPESFSRALYMFDFGQDDLHAALETKTEEEVIASIPYMIGNFTAIFEPLYQEGARFFWVNLVGPVGCLPWFIAKYPPRPGNTDPNGCIKSLKNSTGS